MKDKYVALYITELIKVRDKLGDSDKAQILNALADLLEKGECNPILSPVGEVLWEYISKRITDNWEHYEEVCDIHRKSGKLGGRPKKQMVTEENQKNQMVFEETKKTKDNQSNLSIKYKVESIKNKEEDIDKSIYKTKEERELDFRNKVAEVANGVYSQEMIDRFCNYWTESNEGEKAKLRFEREKVFDISRRLRTWNERSKSNGRATNKTTDYKSQTTEAVRIADDLFAKGGSVF